jgi:hypothetical protein
VAPAKVAGAIAGIVARERKASAILSVSHLHGRAGPPTDPVAIAVIEDA